eukprot:2953935-Rhodomonas_salina.1
MGAMLVSEHASGLDVAVIAQTYLAPGNAPDLPSSSPRGIDLTLSGSSIPPLRLHADRAVAAATRTLYLRLLELSVSPVTSEMYVEELAGICSEIGAAKAGLWRREEGGQGGGSWHSTLVERRRKIREREVQAVLLLGVLQEWVEGGQGGGRGKADTWMGTAVHGMLRAVLAAMPAEEEGVPTPVLKAAALAAAAGYANNTEEADRQVAELVVEAAARSFREEAAPGLLLDLSFGGSCWARECCRVSMVRLSWARGSEPAGRDGPLRREECVASAGRYEH